MDDARYANVNKPAAMQNDGVAGSGKLVASPILDRFRAMLKELEEDDAVLSPDEIVKLYEIVLSELTLNSKPIITDLTIIAGEQRLQAEGIADAICRRIMEVPVEQKLPSLYLLDSIVKNIGREYINYFSSRLPEVFCEAHRQVHPNMHPAMRHLFRTWSTVFPSSVLRKIESNLQFTTSVNHQSSGMPPLRATESPRPTHGIHVNPKYLEARRQFGHATADSSFQPPSGTSTTSKIYSQKPSNEYDEFNSDDVEVDTSQLGAARLSSSIHAGPTSSGPSGLDALKLAPSTGARIARSSSPYGVGHVRSLSPSLEEFAVGNSPGRLVQRASPSNSGLDYGASRVIGSDEKMIDWKRNFLSGDTKQHLRQSAVLRYNNGVDLDRPRSLIDAYGIDKRDDTMNYKYLKFEQRDVNGADRSGATKTWQNTEEEEFDWEDMSPTLGDHGGHKDVFSSSVPPPRSLPTLGTHDAVPLAPHLHGYLSNRAQLPVVNGSSITEDVPSISSSHGVNNTVSQIRYETSQIQGSHYTPESWKLPENINHSSRYHLNATRGRKNLEMPFLGSGILPSAGGRKPPSTGSFLDADTQNCGPPIASTMGSSSLDYLTTETHLASAPASAGVWPPASLHNSHSRPSLPTFQPNRPIRSQLDNWSPTNLVANQNVIRSTFSEQYLDGTESKLQNALPKFSTQQSGPTPLNQQSLGQKTILPQQSLLCQDMRQDVVPPASVMVPSRPLAPQLNHGFAPPGLVASAGAILPNPVPVMQPPMPGFNVANASMHLPGVPMPPLPRGPPPSTSQVLPVLQNQTPIAPNPPTGGDFSSLFSSLMAQGLISLTNQAPAQDPVGLEFDPDLLKVRHESAITALYSDLPRQCTACGLRFRNQEAHSSHMDWHVTKNRISRNRKQKPSRKWFVSVNMWLTGTEALGTDAVPGFPPTENFVEKKDDEELAVPADDDQKACALCGEPFDDFYSDETDEWMYKGAVYMNAPTGSTAGMDRSQLGPIVHAKCRPETSGLSSEDFRKTDADYSEEGSQRKRMRS